MSQNKDKHIVIALLILFFLLIANDERVMIKEFFKMKRIESVIDRKKYKVVGGFEDAQKAANKMSEINLFISIS